MKVAISGLMYPVTMLRYFWDALDRNKDLEVFSIGPFFGGWIPWGGGMQVPLNNVKTPSVPLPQAMSQHHVHPGMLGSLIPDDIDLWLQVDAGWHFSKRPPAKVVALIETDPHVLKATYAEPKAYSDLTFCMQTPYIEWDEIYLPYANDQTKFYPDPQKIDYDACLIGLHYPQRDQLVKRLVMEGKKVYYGLGDVYDAYRMMYNSSRVALSWSSLQDTPVRVFEAMGMGIPLVANRTPDLVRLFEEGKHFLGFDTTEEAVYQVNQLLSDPILRADLSRESQIAISAEHTWDHRIDLILEEVSSLL